MDSKLRQDLYTITILGMKPETRAVSLNGCSFSEEIETALGRDSFLRGLFSNGEKIRFVRTIKEWYDSGLKIALEISNAIFLGRVSEKDAYKAIRILARGSFSESDEEIREGIEILLDNWEVLGYDSLRDAIEAFLNRTA